MSQSSIARPRRSSAASPSRRPADDERMRQERVLVGEHRLRPRPVGAAERRPGANAVRKRRREAPEVPPRRRGSRRDAPSSAASQPRSAEATARRRLSRAGAGQRHREQRPRPAREVRTSGGCPSAMPRASIARPWLSSEPARSSQSPSAPRKLRNRRVAGSKAAQEAEGRQALAATAAQPSVRRVQRGPPAARARRRRCSSRTRGRARRRRACCQIPSGPVIASRWRAADRDGAAGSATDGRRRVGGRAAGHPATGRPAGDLARRGGGTGARPAARACRGCSSYARRPIAARSSGRRAAR